MYQVIIWVSGGHRDCSGRCHSIVTLEEKNNHNSDDSGFVKAGDVCFENSTPSSSCYLQGAAVSLLHHHLHVVQDEVEGHAPNRLHWLLHESAENGLKGEIKEISTLKECRGEVKRKLVCIVPTFSYIL